MKLGDIFATKFHTAILSVALLVVGGFAPRPVTAQIGTKVADFLLRDTSGRQHSPSGHSGKILVLEFWSFKCPVSLAYNDRVAALQDKYRSRGVVVLAVAANENESPAEIARNADNLKVPFPILLDRDGRVATQLQATHTPSVFILDGNGILRYRGAVDNNRQVGRPGRRAFVEDALDALLAGRPVDQPITKEFGCRIKRTP
jgi:peroxiredoxin